MAGFDFTQCVGNLKRGNASKHTKNANVLMNSSTLWYGGPKTGKTTILAKTFNNTDYVMLDFDNNYDGMQDLIISNGGRYFNSTAAVELLHQLLDGRITNTVVIIDALNDVKMMMLDYQIKVLNYKLTQDEYKDDYHDMSELKENLQRSKGAGIGQFQEPTSVWFTNTIGKMTNNSNSINFIHHTTQNANGEKMEGNQSAYASKFDHVYAIVRQEDKKSYFELQTGRSNIAEHTIGLQKGIKDAMLYMKAIYSDKVENVDGTMTGTQFDKTFKNIAKWVIPFKKDVISQVFMRSKSGVKVVWKLADVNNKKDK
jgi:hypothetical protein